ncbi:MAG: chorismate-binding protein, partial [Kiritimatiellaeota bacterium]|nr:chorismate-binding protein [Kiritimatiellota bacterium]
MSSASKVLLQETDDTGTTQWLEFRVPHRLLIARKLGEVLPALEELDTAVKRGYWAAGFIAYEAAPAFDPALVTTHPGPLPLLWFGLYRKRQVRITPEFPSLGKTDPSLFQALEKRWRPTVLLPEFRRAITAIRRKIADGETYQVNYSFRLRAPFRGDFGTLASALLAEGRTSYGAYLDLGEHALCSLSPELFFCREGDRIVCRPMKGTAARGLTPAEDQRIAAELQQSAKNRAENIMIVDMVRNDLGRIARPGSVRAEKLFAVERHDTLWQMTSTVSAKTRATWPDVFRAMFPCASITGAPKVQTAKIISGLETAPRGIYTGAIGFIAPDSRAQFNVAIRTIHLDRQRARLEYGTGAGITWDSRADNEWQECRTKALALVPPQPFELLETMLWRPGHGYALLARHLQRMSDSARYFGFKFARQQVHRELHCAATHFAHLDQRVRLLLDRNGHTRIESTRLPESKIWKIALARKPVSSTDCFLFHKTTHRTIYDTALRQHPACDDVLLFNEHGELTESCLANIVVVRRGRWLTPPLTCGLLAGTQRAELLARGKLKEAIIRADDLKTSDRILLISSVRG